MCNDGNERLPDMVIDSETCHIIRKSSSLQEHTNPNFGFSCYKDNHFKGFMVQKGAKDSKP